MRPEIKTYQSTQELEKVTLRVSKQDSSYVYFTFEANEGLCFYSTLPHQNGQEYRDVVLTLSIEWLEEVELILAKLKEKFPLEILSRERMLD